MNKSLLCNVNANSVTKISYSLKGLLVFLMSQHLNDTNAYSRKIELFLDKMIQILYFKSRLNSAPEASTELFSLDHLSALINDCCVLKVRIG